MNTNPLISSIVKSVDEARTLKVYNQKLSDGTSADFKNKFLFFIKPEITVDKKEIKLTNILELIFKKLDEFNMHIKGVRVVNAAYLSKHQIISRHYGVINRLSSNIRGNITTEGKAKFEEIYGESFDNCEVYGSLEMLKKHPFLSPMALSMLWQNATFNKLAGGTYATKLKFDGSPFYLVNGFHPRQLEHFTTPGRSIVVLILTSDADWSSARNQLIGKTNPLDAEVGSIRQELLAGKDAFGLEEVSPSWNGVHLSAGPIEGLIELMRYNSDFENGICQTPEDYKFGRELIDTLGSEKTDIILRNPDVEFNGNIESIFDLTEEMNTDECIEILKKIQV